MEQRRQSPDWRSLSRRVAWVSVAILRHRMHRALPLAGRRRPHWAQRPAALWRRYSFLRLTGASYQMLPLGIMASVGTPTRWRLYETLCPISPLGLQRMAGEYRYNPDNPLCPAISGPTFDGVCTWPAIECVTQCLAEVSSCSDVGCTFCEACDCAGDRFFTCDQQCASTFGH